MSFIQSGNITSNVIADVVTSNNIIIPIGYNLTTSSRTKFPYTGALCYDAVNYILYIGTGNTWIPVTGGSPISNDNKKYIKINASSMWNYNSSIPYGPAQFIPDIINPPILGWYTDTTSSPKISSILDLPGNEINSNIYNINIDLQYIIPDFANILPNVPPYYYIGWKLKIIILNNNTPFGTTPNPEYSTGSSPLIYNATSEPFLFQTATFTLLNIELLPLSTVLIEWERNVVVPPVFPGNTIYNNAVYIVASSISIQLVI